MFETRFVENWRSGEKWSRMSCNYGLLKCRAGLWIMSEWTWMWISAFVVGKKKLKKGISKILNEKRKTMENRCGSKCLSILVWLKIFPRKGYRPGNWSTLESVVFMVGRHKGGSRYKHWNFFLLPSWRLIEEDNFRSSDLWQEGKSLINNKLCSQLISQ